MEPQRETWPRHYQDRRYLVDLTADELQQWADDLLSGSVVFKPVAWDERMTHVEQELLLRGQSPDSVVAIRAQYTSPDEQLAEATASCAAVGFELGECLVKYGLYKYLKNTLESGLLLISPVSRYSDSSLDDARRDEQETGFKTYLSPGTLISIEIFCRAIRDRRTRQGF